MLRASAVLIAIAAASLSLFGCIRDECKAQSDCRPDQYCFLGRCLARDSLAPGSGGSGGDGGEPWTGNGGGGGETDRPIPREKADAITVEILAGPALSQFLGTHDRKLLELKVTAISRGLAGRGELSVDGPYGWSAMEAPREDTLRLDVGPLKISFDQLVYVDDPIEIKVEARTTTLAQTRERFAHARIFGTVEEAPIPVFLSFDRFYDHDGDGVPDFEDCEPDDPLLQPGQTTVCDGIPTRCHPGICHVELSSGARITGVHCDDASCYVGTLDEPESVLLFDTTSSLTMQAPTLVAHGFPSDELAVASGSSYKLLVLHHENNQEIIHLDISPSSDASLDLIYPFKSLYSNFVWDLSFIYVSGERQSLFVIDPSMLRAHPDCSEDLRALCYRDSFAGLSGDGGPLEAGSEAIGLALRPIHSHEAEILARFDRDRRIGTFVVSVREVLIQDSNLIEALPTAHPRDLAYHGHSDQIYVVGGITPEEAEAAMITNGSEVIPLELPPGACPSVIEVVDDHLLIADDCQSALWLVPLQQGGNPRYEELVGIELPGCRQPSVIAAQGKVESPILVACDDRPGVFLVIGRD